MVEIKNLNFRYGKRPLFSGLSLTLEPGIHGLLGKNGAGKSSLLKIVSGLLFAQQGEIRVMGQDPAQRRPSLLSDIFFLPEEFTLPAISADSYAAFHTPFYPRFSREEFEAHLREFQLEGDRKLSQLSHGQKKKFLLAFGMASGSRILLLDEPTNGLDIPSKSQFRRLVSSALSEERCILISTHQVRDVENLIDPIIIVDEGQIIFQHSLEEISRGIHIRQYGAEPRESETLYAEKALGGWFGLSAGADEEGSGIDLELLFNGVIKDAAKINALIAGGTERE